MNLRLRGGARGAARGHEGVSAAVSSCKWAGSAAARSRCQRAGPSPPSRERPHSTAQLSTCPPPHAPQRVAVRVDLVVGAPAPHGLWDAVRQAHVVVLAAQHLLLHRPAVRRVAPWVLRQGRAQGGDTVGTGERAGPWPSRSHPPWSPMVCRPRSPSQPGHPPPATRHPPPAGTDIHCPKRCSLGRAGRGAAQTPAAPAAAAARRRHGPTTA